MTRLSFALVATILLLASAPLHATECDTPDGDWILCEDFEQGGLGVSAWRDASPFVECLGCDDPGRLQMTNESGRVFDGSWSLDMPAAAASNYRGASLTYRSCADEMRSGCNPLTGYDQLYYRAWVRLEPDHRYVHHFMSLGGTRPGGYWEGDGNAGCRPNGERAAGSTVDFRWSESRGEHELFFYTYYPEMNCDDINAGGGYCGDMQPGICDGCAAKDMPCSNGPECCWGNHFSADPKPVLPRGQWVCLEMMVRLNTPTQSDGEMAFWINDQLGHQQTGMHWRDVPELQLNKVWVQHYIAGGDASESNRIQWDNVVASTSRVYCGQASRPDAGGVLDAAASSDASAGDDAAGGNDARTAVDVGNGAEAGGCVPGCLDDTTLSSCDATGQVILLNCPAGQLCEDAHCQGQPDAGADPAATPSGCSCRAAGQPATGGGLLMAFALAWRRRSRV